jgi:hypothetical protein
MKLVQERKDGRGVRLEPEQAAHSTGKHLFIGGSAGRPQSNRAIISSLAMGVKLSMSRPRDASSARRCCGTSRLLS